jgi:hypothetical protein
MDRYKITCCLGCVDRNPGCHSVCEKYIQQRAELDESKAEDRKKHNIEYGLNASLIAGIQKNAKKNNRRGH